MVVAPCSDKECDYLDCGQGPNSVAAGASPPIILGREFDEDTSVSPRKWTVLTVPHASQSRLTALSDNDLPASADRDPTCDCPGYHR